MPGALYEFEALGTHWWVELLVTKDFPADLCMLIDGQVTSFEQNYSRFIDTSFISLLNDNKELDSPPSELVAMLEFALDVNKKTDGIFNISVGGKLEQLGYGHTVDASAKISKKLGKDVLLSPNKITLANDVRIDLGGFGKGWLVDKLSGILSQQGFAEHIVNGGGDIFVRSSKQQTVYIEHPDDASKAIGEVSISSGGLAASSANRRQWVNESGGQHHVIDPFKASPISTLAAVHIFAESALLADTLSTVFLLIDDLERSKLASRFGVEYLSINHDLSFFASANFPVTMY